MRSNQILIMDAGQLKNYNHGRREGVSWGSAGNPLQFIQSSASDITNDINDKNF